MKKTLQQGLLAALIISITACGGGSSGGGNNNNESSTPASSASSITASSTPASSAGSTSSSASSTAPVSTTYTVSISAPVINEVPSLNNFLVPNAMAADAPSLTGENFAVVIVDLAGNVLERIELDDNDVTQNEDGTYSINVPGNPRLDCLIVTNLNNPIVLPDVANINSLTDLLFAPTTDENVDIDVGSTAAYVNLLNELGGEGDFNDIDLDVNDPDDLALVESIINNVQEVINNQVVTGYDTIEEAIAAIQEAVIAIVEQEALNVTNPAPEEVTLASTINAGGVYWYEASDEDYIEYGEITADTPESIYRFNGSEFELHVDEDNDRDLRLVDGVWTAVADRIEVATLNEDGSAVLRNVGANDDQFLVESTLIFSLTGRNIADYLYATFDTRALAEYIKSDATFSEGAVGLRLNVTSLSDTYRLWYETGAEDGTCPWDSNKNANDFGGNCETLGHYFWNNTQGNGYYDHDQATETLAGILSSDVAPATAGFKMVSVNWPGDNQSINAQLINNEAKTARYYIMTWGENGNQLSAVIGEGTWSYISLPGATGDAAQAIRVDVPEAVKIYGDFDDDQGSYIMTVNSGFVRLGNFEEAGKVVETDFILINSVASDDILGAIPLPISANSICFDPNSTTDNGNNSASGWTQANLHYWSPAPSDALTTVETSWPGFAMAQKGSFYCYDFSELLTGSAMPTTLNVIFNNVGQSAAQTANLTFTAANGACYQNNAWTTLEACGFKAVVDQTQDLLGTWQLGDDYLIFGGDGVLTHIKTATDDVNCQAGLAHGSYLWDQINSSLNVALVTDTTAIDPEDSCSLGGVSSMTLDETGLHIVSDGDEVNLTKVVAAEEAPLNGGWTLDGMDFFVFDGNSFAHAKVDNNNDENCQIGMATGTYSWNQESTAFVTSLISDSTAVAVDDSCSLPGESTMVREGDSLMFTAGEDVFSMTKIGE